MPNRRTVIAAMVSLPIILSTRSGLAQSSVTGDTISTSAGNLIIHPVGHASLALISGAHVIYVDPAKQSFEGLPPSTGILITHIHGDHFNAENLVNLAGSAAIIAPQLVVNATPEALKAQTTLTDDNGSGELDGVPVAAVPAYNTTPERLQFHPKGASNGYIVSFGDKKIYIAGDTEDVPEMRALTGIDVAFLPMNLPNTMDVEHAADAVKGFRPKIVYPYHYRGSDTAKFKELVGDAAEVRLVDWYAGS